MTQFDVVMDYGENGGGEVLYHASRKAFFKVSRILLKDSLKRKRKKAREQE